MTVKIVTDSTSDIPAEIAQELGISVVPIYVMFGHTAYRDRLDIGEDEFYDRLVRDSVHPTTSVPSPNDFAEVYNKLANETDEIVSIHLTSKESGTYNSALLAKELVNSKCRIEVVDSMSVSMSCGLLTMAAAQKARTGASLDEVTAFINRSISRIHLLIMVDTLKYVVRGGRLSKAHGFLGTVLKVKPLLTIRDGNLLLANVARTKSKAVERLYDFAMSFPEVTEAAVAYTTTHDEAKALSDRIQAALPEVRMYVTRVGASLGTHAGPGAMGVAIRERVGEM